MPWRFAALLSADPDEDVGDDVESPFTKFEALEIIIVRLQGCRGLDLCCAPTRDQSVTNPVTIAIGHEFH